MLILFANFAVYKNINKIIPTHQGEIYTFENNIKQEKYNFLYEMCQQLEEQENYKRVDSTTISEEDPVVFNIIKNYTYYKNILEEDYLKVPIYVGKLQNTVYGDLEFLISKTYTTKKGHAYTNFYIVYSKDMKKICFYNLDGIGVEPNNYSIQVKDETYYDENYKISSQSVLGENNNEDINSVEASKNKDEIIKKVKEKFSNVINDIELKPNTIIKKPFSYILQDDENDITIYYDNENDEIFGFYMGFEN